MRKKPKSIIGCLVLLLLISCKNNNTSELSSEYDPEKIFVIAGQSNAMGVGDQEASVFFPKKEVFEYNSVKDTLEILKDPVGQNHLNFQSAQTGSFIPALAYNYNEITNEKVTTIQTAKGGSSLTIEAEINNWGNWSDQGKLFESSIYKTEKALQILRKREVDAIFWCQGENDGNAIFLNLVTKQEYKTAFIELVKKYHYCFGKVPFIIVETGRFDGNSIKDKGFGKVREAQREVAQEMDHVYIGYNETEFFMERGWLVDVVHYNQEALNDIGEKLAHFYISIEK